MNRSHRILQVVATSILGALVIGSGLVSAGSAAAAAAPPGAARFAHILARDDDDSSVLPDPFVERVGGADRYTVSAAISAHTFEPMVPVAYVVSGEVFPDALSASAAAGAGGGAVLLTQKNTLPSTVVAELRRLKPQHIVVLGGTNTIAAGVETALHAFSGAVTRLAGADRYAVSAAVSSTVFGSHRPVAYLASGAAFPDALSGSAAAGRLGGPVLLVEKEGIPTLVADELRRLAPSRIVLLGGGNSISDTVREQASALATTSRVDGADRFAVSASISGDAFPPGVPTAYVASGAVFGDALSGGAAAIADAGPVLLVSTDAIPSPIAAELSRLRPRHIVVLGGTGSVSDATMEQLRSFLANSR